VFESGLNIKIQFWRRRSCAHLHDIRQNTFLYVFLNRTLNFTLHVSRHKMTAGVKFFTSAMDSTKLPLTRMFERYSSKKNWKVGHYGAKISKLLPRTRETERDTRNDALRGLYIAAPPPQTPGAIFFRSQWFRLGLHLSTKTPFKQFRNLAGRFTFHRYLVSINRTIIHFFLKGIPCSVRIFGAAPSRCTTFRFRVLGICWKARF